MRNCSKQGECVHEAERVDGPNCAPCIAQFHRDGTEPGWSPPLTAPEPTKSIADVVHQPSHYADLRVEPITFVMGNGFEFWRGNIIKYASRAGRKTYDGMDLIASEITDLEKVRRYAEMRINQLNGLDKL